MKVRHAWVVATLSAIIAVAVAVSLAGAATMQFQKKSPLKIGYSVYEMRQPYWQAYAKGIQDQAKKDGFQSVLISDQKGSQQTQVTGSANLINQGISALVVSPVQPAALPATISAAHKAKIPIIIGDVGAVGAYDAFILSDNYGGGAQAAKYIISKLSGMPGVKEVAVITLHPGSAVGVERVQGFVDEMKKNPNFKVVAQLNGNDSVEGGFKVTQSVLTANPKLAAIYAANDPEAEGAVQALKQAGKSGVKDVLVIGFNGDPPALDLIKSGAMAATIAQDPYGQGVTAVKVATALLNGKPVTYTKPATKTINFPVKLVDSANIDAFMKSKP